ncbi:MAG: CpsD/CapB family tyrosine-protein kinase, partial [Planctomycetia bacterium]|nr:CpsD/CapB family tyrosine-protein kinase [Planctomycetia bacterium]
PDHPEVRSLRQRMTLTRDFFARGDDDSNAGGNLLGIDPVQWHVRGLQQECADLDTSLKALEQLTESEQAGIRDVQKFKLADRVFREDIARLQGLFEPIIRRLEEIKLIRELGGFDAQVIAPPLPGSRTGTGAVQIILFGTILGLCGGFGLGYLAEVTDKSFRTPEEIRTRLGLPVIGHVPVLTGDASASTPVGDDGVLLDPMLCAYFRTKSTQAEAFRGVRTALYFSTRGEVHKVVQVTSPNASEGKSTTSANLAICIAQSGKRVLLVDADLRKPRQHKIFGLQPKVGLASVIAGETDWKDALHATPVPGLTLLPCGPHPPNPAELLTHPRFKELLDALREEYDFVLIDTPPLLAVSDPSVVAPRADGVILVVRVSKNGRPSAERARDILQSLGVRVLGVVVNGVGAQRGYGYGYDAGSYGYGYRYNYYAYGGDQSYYQDEEEATDEPADNGAPPLIENHASPIENGTSPQPALEPSARTTMTPHRRPARHRSAPPPNALQRFLTWWQS